MNHSRDRSPLLTQGERSHVIALDIDTGHFALEEDGDRIAHLMRQFLQKHVR